MPRTFNGSSDQITCAAGAAHITFGTYFAIVKRGADAVQQTIFNVRDNGGAGANRNMMQIGSGDVLLGRWSGNITSTFTVLASDGWVFLAAAKTTGTAAPSFYKYVYSTNTWTAETPGGTTANSVATWDAVNIGHRASDQRFNGDIALCGLVQSTLTEDAVKRMAFSRAAGWSRYPDGCWIFDQASTSIPLLDNTGQGADQSAITGTTISTSSVPVWSYGADLLLPDLIAASNVAITAVVATARGRTDTVVPSIVLEPAASLALGDALVPTVDITEDGGDIDVTAVVAIARGRTDTVTVTTGENPDIVLEAPASASARSDIAAASVEIGPLAATALGSVLVPTLEILEPDVTVTVPLPALALGDAPAPAYGLTLLPPVADANAPGRVPTILATRNPVITAVVAIAIADSGVHVPFIDLSCVLDTDGVTLGTETLSGVSLGTETLTPLTIDDL